MTFYIKHNDGTSFMDVNDGTLDTTSSLIMVGKNYPTYGEIFNQNFIDLLENFANVNAPENPTQGQIWYDSANVTLKVYRSTINANYWQSLSYLVQSRTQPNVNQISAGDLWWDTTNQQLKIWSNTAWVTIGPQITNPGILRVSGSNSFILQIGGLNVWSVDNYGRINSSYNPVVYADTRYNNLPGQSTFAGAGMSQFNGYVPVNIRINTGEYLDTTTGIFTCPVDGIYEVKGYMRTLGGPVGYSSHQVSFQHNQNFCGIDAFASHGPDISQTLSVSGFISAKKSDSIQFVFAAEEGAFIDDNFSGISIRLVG